MIRPLLAMACSLALTACAGSTPIDEGAPDGDHGGAATTGGNLTFTAQKGWIVEQPSSDMRVAQYSLPKVEGDAEDATLVVYRFAGDAGNIDANLERWWGQFEQPDGGSSKDAAVITVSFVGDMTYHRIEVSGRYVAETFPGSDERVSKDGWRLMAGVLESDAGTYYIKLVGPEATVRKWADSYTAFLDAIQ